MAHYIVGDVHGCYRTLQALLETVDFRPEADHLIFVGDLVGKGPSSGEVVNWVRQRGKVAETLLGNHELHLLRRYFGLRKPKEGDTLTPLLERPDCEEIVNWLVQCPVLTQVGENLVVHAGLFPAWSSHQALRWADHIQGWLRKDPYNTLKPRTPPPEAPWRKLSEDPDPVDTYAAAMALRWLTHIRYVADGYLPAWKAKKFLKKRAVRDRLAPWFELWRPAEGARVFFGHWATLGPGTFGPAVCLDGGCAYGGPLCAYRVEDGTWIKEPNRDLPTSVPED